MISFYIAVMVIWTYTVKAQDDDKSTYVPRMSPLLVNSSKMTAMETGLLYVRRLHSI